MTIGTVVVYFVVGVVQDNVVGRWMIEKFEGYIVVVDKVDRPESWWCVGSVGWDILVE